MKKILAGVPLSRQLNKIKATWKEHERSEKELKLSHRLLAMLKSWSEYEDIKAHIQSKATIRKSNDVQEQVDKVG